jgi:benzoyl-CoA reductase/2-hydroxyglutaryl-CoA dehydratase subunit BcrC/BadD/HgdB
MKTVLYSSPFIPPEWVAAHGLRPERVIPRAAPQTTSLEVPTGICTFARAFVRSVVEDADAAAVVVTTMCDQMRRVPEILTRERDVPVFLMNVPTTWQTPGAHDLYRSELVRLGRFLVGLGGRSPSDDVLARVMMDYDGRRASLRSMRARLSPGCYSEAIAVFPGDVANRQDPATAGPHDGSVPLALVGGPLLQEDFAIFDHAERVGGQIVLDATETGERCLPDVFDSRRVRLEPLTELTRAYFGTIPDASRRPNDRLYEWLREEIRKRGVRGVIYRRHVWCDLWHAELHRLRESLGVPVLDLDGSDDAATAPARLRGRIEAFLEMLT